MYMLQWKRETHNINPLNITGCQVDYSPDCSFTDCLQGKVEDLPVNSAS